MQYQFIEGKTYEAIPTLEGAKRRMVACVGRVEGRIQLAWMDDLSTEEAEMCMDREILRPVRSDGMYFVSSAVPLEIKSAAIIFELLRNLGRK